MKLRYSDTPVLRVGPGPLLLAIMRSVIGLTSIALFLSSVTFAAGGCFDPSPAFPPPQYNCSDPILNHTFATIRSEIDNIVAKKEYDTTHFSIEVSSSQSTLFTAHGTARQLNVSRPGASPITGDSYFRIASITKTYTTLGILQQYAAGNLSLEDPVLKYLPQLSGPLPWKDMTIRSLASQLHGMPRDWSQSDFLALGDPERYGFPPPNNHHVPDCYGYHDNQPCNETDLYHAVSYQHPIFAPNFKSAYSNTAFELLGLLLANVSSVPYEEYIESRILKPLELTGTTWTTPADNVSALPLNMSWFWNVNEGVHNPTGGLYSTSSSLAKFGRYVLNHFNSPPALGTGVNWLQPASFGDTLYSFYGMPWETFRTDRLLPHTTRPVTFFTKGGGVPGYTTQLNLAPEYDLVFTILTAGSTELINELLEAVTVPTIRAAEEIAGKTLMRDYVGHYAFSSIVEATTTSPPFANPAHQQPLSTFTDASELNSSATFTYHPTTGLTLTSFISNSTDVFTSLFSVAPGFSSPNTRIQLIPTLLFVDEENQKGEKWRALITPSRKTGAQRGVWDDFCIADVDVSMYDGRGLNEVVFWRDEDGEGREVVEVEMRAFRVRLRRVDEGVGEVEKDGR